MASWSAIIPGATNATLTLTNIQLTDDGQYSVIASNSFGAVEALAGTLVVLVRPVIAVQPLSQSVVAGGDIVLSVAASGNPLPLSYRWRRNGAALTNMILHSTNCFFTVTNIQPNPVQTPSATPLSSRIWQEPLPSAAMRC